MSIGRFYRPDRSNYVSQFVPDKIPWDTAYKVLENKENQEIAARNQDFGVNIDPASLTTSISDVYGGSSYSYSGLDKDGNPITYQDATKGYFDGSDGKLKFDYEKKLQPSKDQYEKSLQDYKQFISSGNLATSPEGRALAAKVQSSRSMYQGQADYYSNRVESINAKAEELNKDKHLNTSGYRGEGYIQEFMRMYNDDNYNFDETVSIGDEVIMPDIVNKYTPTGDHSWSHSDYKDINFDGSQFKVKKGGSSNAEPLAHAMNAMLQDKSLMNDIKNESQAIANREYQKAIRDKASEEEAQQIFNKAYNGAYTARVNAAKDLMWSKLKTESEKTVDYDASYTGRKEEMDARNMVFTDVVAESSLSTEDQGFLENKNWKDMSDEGKRAVTKQLESVLLNQDIDESEKGEAFATYLNLANKDGDLQEGVANVLNKIYENLTPEYRDNLHIDSENLESSKEFLADEINEGLMREFPHMANVISRLNFKNLTDGFLFRKEDSTNDYFELFVPRAGDKVFENIEEFISKKGNLSSVFSGNEFNYNDWRGNDELISNSIKGVTTSTHATPSISFNPKNPVDREIEANLDKVGATYAMVTYIKDGVKVTERREIGDPTMGGLAKGLNGVMSQERVVRNLPVLSKTINGESGNPKVVDIDYHEKLGIDTDGWDSDDKIEKIELITEFNEGSNVDQLTRGRFQSAGYQNYAKASREMEVAISNGDKYGVQNAQNAMADAEDLMSYATSPTLYKNIKRISSSPEQSSVNIRDEGGDVMFNLSSTGSVITKSDIEKEISNDPSMYYANPGGAEGDYNQFEDGTYKIYTISNPYVPGADVKFVAPSTANPSQILATSVAAMKDPEVFNNFNQENKNSINIMSNINEVNSIDRQLAMWGYDENGELIKSEKNTSTYSTSMTTIPPHIQAAISQRNEILSKVQALKVENDKLKEKRSN